MKDCEGTFQFLSECTSIATMSCCHEEHDAWQAACSPEKVGNGEAEPLRVCKASTARLVGCMKNTYNIKDRIALLTAEEQEQENLIMKQEEEHEKADEGRRRQAAEAFSKDRQRAFGRD